jgi:uncharacterized protein (DUF305 family)
MHEQALERPGTRLSGEAARRWALPAVLALAVLLAAGWLVSSIGGDGTPGDNSVAAGFARDMNIHHAQAVEMALIVRDRTDNAEIRQLCTDILLTQQNQIGQMEGWLNAWALPLTGDKPAMAWMGHPTTGLMPGMATPEQIDNLRTLPVNQMNVLFL